MKKAILFALTAVLLMAALTGCVREDIGVKINEDGTGSVTVTVGIKKSFYDQLKEAGSEDPFEEKETFTEEYDGQEYISVKETQLFDSVEEIENALKDMKYSGDEGVLSGLEEAQDMTGYEDTEIMNTEETEGGDAEMEADSHIFKSVEIIKEKKKCTFNAVLNKITGEGDIGFDPNEMLKVSVSVELPGKIKAYSDGSVSGSKVTFDIKDVSKENEIYAESETGSALPAVIGTVVIIGGIVAVIMMRRKKK